MVRAPRFARVTALSIFLLAPLAAVLVLSAAVLAAQSPTPPAAAAAAVRRQLSGGDTYAPDPLVAGACGTGISLLPALIICAVIAALGIEVVAVHFFVPTFEAVVARLGLDVDVAGALLLAAASSSPEVLAAGIGVFIEDSNGVGIGTVVGSAVFNALAITSGVALVAKAPPQLRLISVTRDTVAMTIAVAALAVILADGAVQWYESLTLIAMYAAYAIVVSLTPVATSLLAPAVARCGAAAVPLPPPPPPQGEREAEGSDDGTAAAATATAATTMASASADSDASFSSPSRFAACAATAAVVARAVACAGRVLRAPLWVVVALILPQCNERGEWHYFPIDVAFAIARNNEVSARASKAGAVELGEDMEEEDAEAGREALAKSSTVVSSTVARSTAASPSLLSRCAVAPIVWLPPLPLFWLFAAAALTAGLSLFAVLVYALISSAEAMGCIANISPLAMGLTVVAIGTSLPDFWVSLAVARSSGGGEGASAGGVNANAEAGAGAGGGAGGGAESSPIASPLSANSRGGQMAFSNILGSNIFDLLFGLGFPWVLRAAIFPSTPTIYVSKDVASLLWLVTLALFGSLLVLLAPIIIDCIVRSVKEKTLVALRVLPWFSAIYGTIYIAFLAAAVGAAYV